MLRIATVALLVLLPLSVARADDRSEFNEYVETCIAEHGTTDKLVAACVDTQVAAKENYLADILSETEGMRTPEQVTSLRAAQDAWESYRDKSCAYHAGLKPRDEEPRALMCRLRLVNLRIAEILENEDFADFED